MTLKDPTGSHAASPCLDHPQFFERALSRRRLLRLGAGAAVSLGAASLPIWRFGLAAAVEAGHDIVLPNPIPGGLTGVEQGCPGITELFHLFVPSYPAEDEPSSITDFNGFHGDAHIQGVGTATNTATGKKIQLFYDADLRFMKGVYIGVDGKTHDGTFGFV